MGKHSKYKKARKLKAHVASAEEKACFEDMRRREIEYQRFRTDLHKISKIAPPPVPTIGYVDPYQL